MENINYRIWICIKWSTRKRKCSDRINYEKYCIHVIIEVKDINEVEISKKVDYVTQEVIGHYQVTKDKELYQIDKKAFGMILHNQILDDNIITRN